MTNFVKYAVDNGGILRPLYVPAELTGGLGLMNPSIYNDNGQLMTTLRNVNYTFYHSEGKLFQHQFGAIAYVHPEDDLRLKTINYYLELSDDLEVLRHDRIDMTEVETHEPLWQFWGLEDVRLVRWDNKLYISGVRRDTTPTGQWRIELTEIEVGNDYVKGQSRFRIPLPNGADSYCEKNWMPITDMPYHFVKWTNPTEVVKVNPDTKTCDVAYIGKGVNLKLEQRGSSQVIPYGDNYLGITHESNLFKDELGHKDATYRHRFIVWDKQWNIIQYSSEFDFMTEHVGFCAGLCRKGDNLYISFAFQDNVAFVLRVPEKAVDTYITITNQM